MRLSKNFTLAELTRSQTAARLSIDNTPPPDVVARLQVTCERLMEPIRTRLGRPIMVTSGYRSPALNVAVGSKPRGQHPKGEAVDFEVPGFDNLFIARLISGSKIPFDQLILEGYRAGEPSSGWIHVSHHAGGANRGEVLTATVTPTGWSYSSGLPG